jgi:hypothetical protein
MVKGSKAQKMKYVSEVVHFTIEIKKNYFPDKRRCVYKLTK